MADKLRYTPLNEDEDEIRLINICPYTGRSSIVNCELNTVSLKSCTVEYQSFLSTSTSTGRKQVIDWMKVKKSVPTNFPSQVANLDTCHLINPNHRFLWGDYATLSYVWGHPGDASTIILNGQEVQVQRNLEVALRSLSSRAEFAGKYRLWVDAISINQQDYIERSRQITKMKDIYGDALEVLAWIGEEGENSDKAIDLLQILSQARSKECGEELEKRLREDPEYLGFGCWMALHDFMDRNYWYRLWIIQEVILGSSSVVLRCGSRSIDWRSFCESIGFLFGYLWNVKDLIFQREVNIQYPGQERANVWSTASLHLVFRDLWALSRNQEYAGSDHLSFGQLLDLAQPGISQDSRDKVYGLVGIMDPVLSEKILPNYSLSTSKVYAATAESFISVYGNLEPIREGNPWGEMKPPSWAADWTWNGRIRHGRVTEDIVGPFWRPRGLPPVSRLAKPYHASGESAMEVLFSKYDLHLTCRGFIVDEVDGLGAREHGYFHWSSHTIQQPKSQKNVYQNPEGVIEALWRTLIADRVAGGLKASERHAVILNMPSKFKAAEKQFKSLGWTWLSKQRGYYFRWSGWRLANGSFKVMGKPLDHYFKEIIPSDASEYDYTEAYSCNNRTGQGRRFMTTMNGYMGWAPDNMYGDDETQVKVGDKIAILFGCSTPIVIRPHESHFQVLGESYVQGLMEGEAMELLNSGQLEAQNFTFC